VGMVMIIVSAHMVMVGVLINAVATITVSCSDHVHDYAEHHVCVLGMLWIMVIMIMIHIMLAVLIYSVGAITMAVIRFMIIVSIIIIGGHRSNHDGLY
jgi:hypothetical protein